VTHENATPAGPLTVTALGHLVGMSQGHVSSLVAEGLIDAPAGKGRRRAIPAAEVRRVVQVVQLAAALDIAPTVLLRAFRDGAAALLPDGRVALGAPTRGAAA
jgi:hypothetical protein